MLTLGISLLVGGLALRLLPRWGLFQWGVNARNHLIEDYESNGEVDKAAKLKNEVHVLQERLPVYSNVLIAIGLAIIVAAVVFMGHAG